MRIRAAIEYAKPSFRPLASLYAEYQGRFVRTPQSGDWLLEDASDNSVKTVNQIEHIIGIFLSLLNSIQDKDISCFSRSRFEAKEKTHGWRWKGWWG